MNLKLLVLTMITIIPTHNIANAAIACTRYTPCPAPDSGSNQYLTVQPNSTCGYSTGVEDNDLSTPDSCYKISNSKIFQFDNCTECANDKILKQVPVTVFGGVTDACNNLSSEYVYACCYQCSSSTCVSDTSYQSAGEGYEEKVTRTCSACDGCVKTSTQVRCAAGYYGDGSTCSACPIFNNTVQSTSIAGSNTEITNCFLPSGTPFSNDTGRGEFTSKCYYTKGSDIVLKPTL